MAALPCPARFAPREDDAALLLKIVGPGRFKALQKTFGGRRIWVPKAGSQLPCRACGRRDQCIALWRRQGRSAAVIAKRLKVSPKTVYRVLAGEAV